MSSSHHKAKNSKRRYSLFPKPLAKGLSTPLSKALRKRGFEHEAILHYWPMVAGSELATIARPIRLKSSQDEKHSQLIVKVQPAYRLIIAHQSEQILQRYTHYLGYRPAAKIICVGS